MSGAIPFVESLSKQGATIKDIASSDECKFQWYIQKYFRVLPTDPRFLSLTEEQLDLLYENFMEDQNKSKQRQNKKSSVVDREFDNPEDMSKKGTTEYYDPEFEELWNEIEEEHNEIMNNSTAPTPTEDLQGYTPTVDFNNENEWEEV